MTATADTGTPRAEHPRSLAKDAAERLTANRLASGSLAYLVLMTALCLIGPYLTGHPYDKVYPEYVGAAPRLAAYPEEARIAPALGRIAARLRARTQGFERTAGGIRATLVSERPIDERGLAYFPRSDVFGPATVVSRDDDGRRLVVEAAIAPAHFYLGTDLNGRDLLTRSLMAGRISLAAGAVASLVALLIGVAYGAISGYAGGRTDAIMMRIVEILYALPFIFLVIVLVVVFGRSALLVFAAIGAIEWLDMARIVRGQALSLRRQEFVAAAEALGVGAGGILRRHIIPNAVGPIVVFLTLLVPRVILIESFLSFLGLGVQEPMTSWGVLIAEGARSIETASYLLVVPAAFLVSTLFALNFLGDGLRDALDPKER